MPSNLAPIEDFRIPVWRRSVALAIDFAVIAVLAILGGTSPAAQGTLFILGWLVLRIVVVSKNKGQSLGRWALDMRVIDGQRGGTPDLLTLTKREGPMAIEAFLAFLGLLNLSPANAGALLLLLPLAIDCGLALLDIEQQRALHDQYAKTLMVQTRRGYSLDIKIRNLVADLRHRMKQ